MAEGDGLSGRIGQRRSDVRRLAGMFREGQNVRAFGQHDQPLLESLEQVIDLRRFILGLVLLDLANGEGVQLTVVAEKNSETSVSFLQRRHDCALRSITTTSGKSHFQNFTKSLVKRNRQEVRICRNPLP